MQQPVQRRRTGRQRQPSQRRHRVCPGAARGVRFAGRLLAVLELGGLLSSPRLARGQVRLPPVRVEGTPPGASPEADSPSFVSVVEVPAPTARAVSVAELVEREAGVRVRSQGGLGAFSSVSIRGSDSAEVAVFLDGVPLNRAVAAAVDLSQLPADAIERIEIYRGMPPPELGGYGLSGAINLISRRGDRAGGPRASVGGGDFGARSVSAGLATGSRALHADANLSYRGAVGNFAYYDTNGTDYNVTDDRWTLRRNNGFDQLAADVALGGRAGAGGATDYRLGAHGFWKSQGVPGRGEDGFETRTAHASTVRLLVDGQIERRAFPFRAADLRLGGSLLWQRTAFANPDGELVGGSGAAHSEGETLAANLDARLQAAIGTHQLASALVTFGVDQFQPRDLMRPEVATPRSQRLRAALVLADDLRWLADRLAITPSLRLELVDNQLGDAIGTGGSQARGQHTVDAFPTVQVGLRARILPWLALKGSLGRYLRLPTTLELFGDDAFFRPRPGLRPETAIAGDLGVSLDGSAGPLRVFGELTFFGRQVSDYIAIQGSQNALSAANVGDQRFLGVEARLKVRLAARLGLLAGYTFLAPVTTGSPGDPGKLGQALPNLPAHKLDARADLDLGPFHLFYELAFTGDVSLSPYGTDGQVIPARALHAAGGRAGPWPRWPLSLSIEVRNLADLRVVQRPGGDRIHAGQSTPEPLVDFYYYPLPGRAVYLTLAWQP